MSPRTNPRPLCESFSDSLSHRAYRKSTSWPPQSGRDCAAVPRTSGMGRNLPLDPQVTMRQAISTEGFALILQFQAASG
jgi:hypothetical protein